MPPAIARKRVLDQPALGTTSATCRSLSQRQHRNLCGVAPGQTLTTKMRNIISMTVLLAAAMQFNLFAATASSVDGSPQVVANEQAQSTSSRLHAVDWHGGQEAQFTLAIGPGR